jgi:hypothetical protein
VYDKSSFQIYTNGVQVGPGGNGGTNNIVTSGQSLLIGKNGTYSFSGNTNNFLNGQVADVRIWTNNLVIPRWVVVYANGPGMP